MNRKKTLTSLLFLLMAALFAFSACAPQEAEVVEARHCNSGYKTGDKFILDIDGNFISKLCPKRLCVYLVSQLAIPVALINERVREGLAPNGFHFMHIVKCLDAGVECKGYGETTVKVAVVERK